MKVLKRILLSILCISVLSLAIFIGYRMISSDAEILALRSNDKKSDFTYYIEYNGRKYDEYSLLDFSENYNNYYLEEKKDERLTFCKHIKPFSFITFPIYGYGENNDILFRRNNGILGPLVGWVYIRDDYIFPTVQNNEVSYVELQFSPKESIIFKDEETVNMVIDCIKKHEDISDIFSIEKYGIYKFIVHYKGAPVCEYVGAIWDGNMRTLVKIRERFY